MFEALVEQVYAARGSVIAVDVPASDITAFTGELTVSSEERSPKARLVLGAASRTAVKAVEQFCVALQLPYEASRGWVDFLDALGERGVSRREYVVVADGADLLEYEDLELWRDLVRGVSGGPYCLGGGWTTVVLCDADLRWNASRFGSAADVVTASRYPGPE